MSARESALRAFAEGTLAKCPQCGHGKPGHGGRPCRESLYTDGGLLLTECGCVGDGEVVAMPGKKFRKLPENGGKC